VAGASPQPTLDFPRVRCSYRNLGSGLEVFTFHRNFIATFMDGTKSKPDAPKWRCTWTALPPQLKALTGRQTWVNDVNRTVNDPSHLR